LPSAKTGSRSTRRISSVALVVSIRGVSGRGALDELRAAIGDARTSRALAASWPLRSCHVTIDGKRDYIPSFPCTEREQAQAT